MYSVSQIENGYVCSFVLGYMMYVHGQIQTCMRHVYRLLKILEFLGNKNDFFLFIMKYLACACTNCINAVIQFVKICGIACRLPSALPRTADLPIKSPGFGWRLSHLAGDSRILESLIISLPHEDNLKIIPHSLYFTCNTVVF